MSRLLIGSSNVYRHYKASAYNKFPEYSMIRCVDIDSFVAQMENLEPTETQVVVSVVENFIGKASEGKKDEERNVAIFEVIKRYLVAVEDAARKNPGTKMVLIDPILRPKLNWYDDNLEVISNEIKDIVKVMGIVNITRLDVISRASQEFEEDGVHLTKKAGRIFVESILDSSEKFFDATFIDLSSDGPNEATRPTAKMLEMEGRIKKLEWDTEERRWNDNLLFARTREELDLAANKTKEDRIVITGLTSKTPPPADREQKKIWLRQLVIDTIKVVKPDFDGALGFVNQGKSNGREIPMVECRLNSVEVASSIRKAYAEKRKAGDGNTLGKLYMSNAVTLSTRVRIDVMRAIAKKVTNDRESAYVAAYSSRPILHVRTKNAAGQEVTNRAYTFIDAVIRYFKVLVDQDLDEAYKRAGNAFKGTMEQHFVVLREWRPQPQPQPQPKNPKDVLTKSAKRTREETNSDEQQASKSKKT